MQAETGVAHVDQVRTGVGQRDHAGPMLEQRCHAGIDVLEKLANKRSLQALLQGQVKERIDRIHVLLPGHRGHCHAFKFRMLGQRRQVHLDAFPVAQEQHARLRMAKVLTEPCAECRVGIDGRQILRLPALDRVKCAVAEQQVRVGQVKVERQWLAAREDVDLVAAVQGLRADVVVGQAAGRLGFVVHRQHGRDIHRSTGLDGDRLHHLWRQAGSGRGHEDTPSHVTQHAGQRAQFGLGGNRRRHRPAAIAAVVGRERRRKADCAGVHRFAKQAAHLGHLGFGGLYPFRGRLAHHRRAHHRMAREDRGVQVRPGAPELRHVFGEGLEVPLHARKQGIQVHALHHGEVLHHGLAHVGRAGCDAEAAVADDCGGNAQCRRR